MKFNQKPKHYEITNAPRQAVMNDSLISKIKSLFTLLIILFISSQTLFAQTQSITVDTTITADCEFYPFNGVNTIYGLTFSGSVTLNSDSSLVRLVYIDNDNNEWLLIESYPLITNDQNVSYTEYCDETCYLETSVTGSIIAQIVNASVTIDSLTYSTVLKAQASQLQFQAKENSEYDKITVMNHYIADHDLRWQAGYTGIVKLWYSQKSKLLGDKYNYFGFEYYNGGLFETVYTNPDPIQTSYIPHFDWRNRHDANVYDTPYYDGDDTTSTGWITSIKNQGPDCGACGVFGSIASIEAISNLYYNESNLDFDLSEQEIVSCASTSVNICEEGILPTNVFNYIYTNKIIDEESFPYAGKDLDCNDETHNENPNYEVSIAGCDTLLYYLVDEFISQLIDFGPYVVLIDVVYQGNEISHAFLLTGYEVNTEENEIYWLVKNSWGENWGNNGFAWISVDVLSSFHPTTPEIPFGYTGSNPPSMHCFDKDNDGICWWGIDEDKPSGLCPTCPDYNDCDDNDPSLGGYDENYYCECLYSYNHQPRVISISDDWITPQLLDRDILIQPGKTLKIYSDVRMVETSRIIVEAGATLIVDGGHITNMCDEFWEGIEVRGSAYIGQEVPGAQGKVQLINGAIIENARVGIETIKRTRSASNTWAVFPTSTGGIIQSDGTATFLNCRTAVKFNPYPLDPHINADNLSYFMLTEFIVDDAYLPLNESFNLENYNLNEKFEQHVYLNGVSGIDFSGCEFENDIHFPTSFNSYGLRGHGIYSVNSDFKINRFDNTASQFINFEYGVYALSSISTTGLISIYEANFNHNVTGIYISHPFNMSSPHEIVFNNFIATPPNYFQAQETSGIYIDNTADFVIEENNIKSNYGKYGASSQATSYGIVVNNCGEISKRLYNNSLDSLHYGIQVQNQNRSSDGITGLSILCNDFTKCEYDYVILAETPITNNDGIVEQQGSYEEEPDAPAGNTFHIEETPSQNDIFNYINNIDYWYHKNGNGFDVKPQRYSAQLVNTYTNNDEPQTYNKEISCESDFTIQGGHESSYYNNQLIASTTTVDSINSELDLLVDNGDTDLLNDEVQNSWPDETMEVREELLSASPYLSDTVMVSAAAKEDVIPNSILTEVLVANPQSAKNSDLLDAVDQRDTLLYQDQIDLIMAGKFVASAKNKLEASLIKAKLQRDFALKNLIISWKKDSIPSYHDSILNLLNTEDRIPAKYSLINEYLFIEDTGLAYNIYNEINIDFELTSNQISSWQNYKDWLDFRIKQIEENQQVFAPDSSQKIGLYNLFNNSLNELNATVRNLLIISDTLTYHEPYLKIDTTLKESKVRWRPIREYDEKGANDLLVYPNPSNNYVIIDYSKIVHSNNLILKVINTEGHQIKNYNLAQERNFKVIDTRDWKSGFYIINVFADSKSKYSKVISIVH